MVPPGGGAAPAATTPVTGLVSNSCTRICGNISIFYPFGNEPGCYHATGFNLTCNHSYQPRTVRINSTVARFVDDGSSHTGSGHGATGHGLPEGGPYFPSESASMLEVIGCDTQVSILREPNHAMVSSCTPICPAVVWPGDGGMTTITKLGNGSSCTGIGSCQASIVLGYSSVYTEICEKSRRDSKAPKIMSSTNQLHAYQNQRIQMQYWNRLSSGSASR
ncbi:wall-associated receptor kinase-like 10 [Miscanthus floridulus]|uniref:wall-associated receptor kinase-like 10 n=1 Tax=Miscanthus floridulus TaxID=154761 RepID=UPI0034579253